MIRHPFLIAYITVALPKQFLSRLGKKEERDRALKQLTQSWGGNPIDVSQEGSDEVGDCRLLVLEIQIEECKLANCSISGKRERANT